MFDPISHVVYAAARENVTHTWVNGRNVLKNRELTQFDLNGLLETVKMWQSKIAS
jgi:5-methylthioadenosine/S-adenosylhomocysteine deaminase